MHKNKVTNFHGGLKLIPFWDIVDRAYSGQKVGEDEWNMTVFRKGEEIVKELGIKWDKETIVNSDNSLADEVFNAGLNFLVESGCYCLGTGRIIKFSEDEISARALKI